MAKRNLRSYTTAAFDCETDPFQAGRVPEPFCCWFVAADGVELHTWGSDCVPEIMAQIAELPGKYLVYVHAGGQFDFHFLWDHIEEPVTIIGGRLVEFCQRVKGREAGIIWRDSLAILPMPLAEFGHKPVIDYAILERDRREKNRVEIDARCRADAAELLRACETFRLRFEPSDNLRKNVPLTLGQLALREFSDRHEWLRSTRSSDAFMRPWYFGGRNQCFAGGILEGPWVCHDNNSHYGAAMAQSKHPVSDEWIEMGRPPRTAGPWFARVLADNREALPWRDPDHDNRIEFNISHGEFWACGHELIPAIEAGQVKVHEWREIWKPATSRYFDTFVTDWMAEKTAAEERGDALGRLLAKLIIASVSGKFGQDPRQYRDWQLLRDPNLDERLKADGWDAESIIRATPDDWLELWSRPSVILPHAFVNVGIAASITSASRASLLAALALAGEPIYCDTDSIVSRTFAGEVDPTKLGAWKFECEAEWAAIAGRKTYCLYNKVGRKIVPLKWASKGETMTPAEIIHMARGGAVERINAAPRFSLRGAPVFTHATYRATL